MLLCIPASYGQNDTSAIPMVEIPAGSFYMGGMGEGEDYDEAPVQK